MHGVGSNEKHLFSFANFFPENFIVISARAPFIVGQDKYAWFEVQFLENKRVINEEQEAKSSQILNQFISQAVQRYEADEQQVFLVGFSQGAIMSYTMGLIRPNKIKAVVAMAGRILDQAKAQIANKNAFQNIRFLIQQGTIDTVMPLQYGIDAAAYLETNGIKNEFKTYPNGHTVSMDQIRDLVNWIASIN